MKRLLLPLIIVVGFALSTGQTALAYFMQPLDVKWHADQSDAVYKVRVISAVRSDVLVAPDLGADSEGPTTAAGVEITAPIKGMARGKIEIVWPAGSAISGYTVLTAGKTYLVFLKGDSSPFQFANPRDSAMEVPAGVVNYRYGPGPYDRLLAELLRAADSEDAKIKRMSIYQLGRLGDIRAADILRRFSPSRDISEKGAALVSRIEIGDPPAREELLSVLRLDLSRSPSRVTMGSSGHFTAGREQSDLIHALEMSVSGGDWGKQRPTKQLRGFDYLSFITDALKCDVIAQNDVLRSGLAQTVRSLADPKSIPILVGLPDDRFSNVRYLAATAFAAIAAKNDYYVASDIFNADESKYINYWKDWAVEHPEGR